MKNRNIKIFLALIILLAFFLRVINLDKVPIELFGDEIDVGNQAYSILKTGRDYSGNSFPLMFKSLDEYRLPVFIYSDTLFIKIFGLNEYGVRLNGVFWGFLGIVGIYLLSKKLFNNNIALISTLFLSISPWHLQYSRQGGIEAGALLAVLIFAVTAFLYGLEKRQYLLISALLFGFSVYIYATGVIFVVLIIPLLILLTWRRVGPKKLFWPALIFILILLPFINLFFSGQGGNRFSSISVWSDKNLIDEIRNRRKNEDLSFSSKIFHNKYQIYFYEISRNLLETSSPSFLFSSGDPNLRHSVGGMGLLYLFDAILIIFGVKQLFNISTSFLSRNLVLIWLIMAPVASSLTLGGGHHASRLMLMLPMLVILSSLGFNFLLINYRKIQVKVILFLVTILMVLNFTNYLHRYYIDWPLDSFRFWHYGFEETMKYVKSVDHNYSRIYFNNSYEPSLSRFLFWYQYDPKLFQSEFANSTVQEHLLSGFDGFKLNEKYYFGNLSSKDKFKALEELTADGSLYVVSASDEIFFDPKLTNESSPFKILHVTYNPYRMEPERQPIFFVVTKNELSKTEPSSFILK